MVYGIVGQHDHDLDVDDEEIASTSPNPQRRLASPVLTPLSTHGLFLDDPNTRIHHRQEEYRSQRADANIANGRGLNYMVQSIASRSTNSKTNTSYDMLEEDDFENDVLSSPALSGKSKGPSDSPLHLHIPRARRSSPATKTSRILPLSPSKEPIIVRTASGRSLALRHPTPDLQALQGAYKGNIIQLEKTAEELSMTSSIDDAIKQLHDEQKRSDSRRSSLLSSQGMQAISRQVSNASSIVEVNSAARSGGFSPAAPYLMSPKGSLSGTTGGRNRSASKSSRFGTRPEPELEGRPLDSFVNVHSMHSSSMSPTSARATSIAEQEEESSTLTREVFALLKGPTKDKPAPKAIQGNGRPSTSTSTIYDNPEAMFEGFDGTHVEPIPPPPSPPPEHHISFSEVDPAILESNIDQRRLSSGNRLSMARPQSYADPVSGQQMVYYPAPVPMMLNLPQKLSKMPSSMARNKRRSQLLENIPAAARQSAIWLPDVLEDEAGLPEDDEAQHQEYIPQHQRASMGGRRLTEDLSHMPPQLRASTFFDLPGPTQIVELKEQSAVATLDSILDASAHAPVSAFTDHAFAGHLGAEVYGRTSNRNSRSSTQLLDPQKKRNSSFNLLLRGRRASSNELDLDAKRRSTMSGVIESAVRSPLEDGDSEDGDVDKESTPLQESEVAEGAGEDEEWDEGQRDDEYYHGPPTTLLAELQLRKQQAKQRTRPLAQSYPNGTHSTLLELDAVAQVQQKSRKKKRTILAWEDPDQIDHQHAVEDDDDDVPLGVLFAKKDARDANRPMGLMERREMEDNEPLSQRRNRLQGRPPVAMRATTMLNLSMQLPAEQEGETLAQRVRRLKEAGGTATGIDEGNRLLPVARPVSGDFASEFGDLLDIKGKGKEIVPPPTEEEETLGQRRKRLQAEKEARAKEVGIGMTQGAVIQEQRPEPKPRRSMADILQAHPSTGADKAVSYQKPVTGLLGLHEQQSARRASTLLNFDTSNIPGPAQAARVASGERANAGGFRAGQYNDGQGGIIPSAPVPAPLATPHGFNMYNGGNVPFAQPSLATFPAYGAGNQYTNQMMMPFASPFAMGGGQYMANPMQMQMGYMPAMQNQMNMNMAMQMNQPLQPLNPGQIEMVERWRQSVMQ